MWDWTHCLICMAQSALPLFLETTWPHALFTLQWYVDNPLVYLSKLVYTGGWLFKFICQSESGKRSVSPFLKVAGHHETNFSEMWYLHVVKRVLKNYSPKGCCDWKHVCMCVCVHMSMCCLLAEFSDTVKATNVKLCFMVVLAELYLYILLPMTLTSVLGRAVSKWWNQMVYAGFYIHGQHRKIFLKLLFFLIWWHISSTGKKKKKFALFFFTNVVLLRFSNEKFRLLSPGKASCDCCATQPTVHAGCFNVSIIH